MLLSILENKDSDNSKFARKELEKLILKEKGIRYFLQFNSEGKPLHTDNIYWSLSHKTGLIFLSVHDSKVGVDIEWEKIRDSIFLDNFLEREYNILGGKNWENFYFLWTAKESIIKYCLGKLDDMGDILLLSKEKSLKTINNINFFYKFQFSYKGSSYKVIVGKKGKQVYSVCY